MSYNYVMKCFREEGKKKMEMNSAEPRSETIQMFE